MYPGDVYVGLEADARKLAALVRQFLEFAKMIDVRRQPDFEERNERCLRKIQDSSGSGLPLLPLADAEANKDGGSLDG